MSISMERWKGKVAVVTGASSGIGAAIAEKLVNSGLTVVGLARRKEKVEELAKRLEGKPKKSCMLKSKKPENERGKFYALKADVSKAEDILQAFKWIQEKLGPVQILVNNAGIMRGKGLIDGETHLWDEVFETNVLGLCVATREAIKHIRSNNVDGHIIHINSIAGHTVPNAPDMNVYPASKYAVTALTETLRQELNSLGSKIKITSISPGTVETEIVQAAGATISPEIMEFFKTAPVLKPEDIAESVYYVLATPPHVQIHELTIKPVGEMF